ncbi:MAG: sulfotransferase domain-containing protein [Planctomycetes bacterium]|nr:sulfotransferase domain-containing protein [Planctomycetota bacterium]
MTTVRSLFLGPIKSLLKRFLPTATPAGFTSIRESVPEDIFIVSYPKSGNTWFQYLASAIVYGIDPEATPDSVVQELVPDVHALHYYKRFSTPTFFKSHDLPAPEHRRVVYLLRDGRDAMVSFLHYIRVCRHPDLDFLEFVRDVEKWSGQGRWSEHVESWLANPHRAEMIVVRYEDLLVDTVGQLERFCAFVDIEPKPGRLQEIAAKTTFAKMRQKEINQPGWANGSHASWPKDQFFMRRGQCGSYKDEMPAEVLEAFLRDASATLAKCGYELSMTMHQSPVL